MIRQAEDLFPQLSGRIEFVEYSTPVTNVDCLRRVEGGIYGSDHSVARYEDPMVVAKLRPKTDIPGLFITGQDVVAFGVAPTMLTGVMTASEVLGRNVAIDLVALFCRIRIFG